MKAICCLGDRLRHFADSSAHRNRHPFFIPDASAEWVARICPAIKISRLGTHISRKFASRYYDSYAAVVMFMPSSEAVDFANADERFFICDSAYCVGDSTEIGTKDAEHVISAEGKEVRFTVETLGVDETVSRLSEFSTLKMGDLIIFAENSFDIAIREGDQLTVETDGREAVDVKIK